MNRQRASVVVMAIFCGCGEGPLTPTGVAVASQQNPAQITTDSKYVYWTDLTGGILKTRLDAADLPPTTLVSHDATQIPSAILVDRGVLYWSNSGDYLGNNGSIVRMDLDSDTVLVLASGIATPYAIATDGEHVYWTNGASVLSVPVGGGSIQRLAFSESGAAQVVVSGEYLYWINESLHAVRRLRVNDSTTIPTTVAVGSHPTALSVDATSVYWADYDGRLGSIEKVAVDGGPRITLASGGDSGGMISANIVSDPDSIYWTTASRVMSVDVDGSGLQALAENNQTLISIAIGSTDVYWAARQDASNEMVIRRVSK